MKMFKLGTPVTEMATKQKGMLVRYQIRNGGNIHYLFAPKGIQGNLWR